MARIDFIFFDAGEGHRSTANALYQVIEKQSFWQPRMVNIHETKILDSIDMFYGMTGIRGTDIYNLMLKKGWTRLDPLYLFLSKLSIRHKHSAIVSLLENYWLENQPDLVVSCIPIVNRVLWESLQKVIPATPFVTILTDFADCPPNYWIEPQEQFLICPTERAVEQARSLGYREEFIFRTSGLVINPQFYEPITVDRRIERQKLGLEPDLSTGLVMFGGQGSTVMLEIAECLERSPLKLQLIFLCGRNQKLATTLRRSKSRLPRFVETFTSEIPYYMHLSDFLIGKPGNISISEAVAMKLPVITECNISTLMQERYCSQWIVDNKVGIVIRNFRNIDRAVAELIQPKNLASYRANAATLNNQAVFEIPNILQQIIVKTGSVKPTSFKRGIHATRLF
ncbi:UDP-N-acetylglucosamine--LPS N-acetylglucosamine transferase [Pleurocapsales cyanobacterium LEGE 06147]|nr:UDP-N-acetylglucosamine--LPS N-acetylglucosamine transferase [Pleurocapsales cyanobacterium LEGE 06147]